MHTDDVIGNIYLPLSFLLENLDTHNDEYEVEHFGNVPLTKAF